jgi:hypothetical protein
MLKINHDIHEFILDSGTVANIYSVQDTRQGGHQNFPPIKQHLSTFKNLQNERQSIVAVLRL